MSAASGHPKPTHIEARQGEGTPVSAWRTVVAEPNELGESPFWHPVEQQLYWVDLPAQRILRTVPGSGLIERWALPQEPGCIAPAARGGLVVAMRDGVYRAHSWGGPLQKIASMAAFDHDPATTRFNDGKCDPLGRFWAGTIYEPRSANLAKLYAIDCRGGRPAEVTLQACDAITANGLAWSPDGGTVYWADTPHHIVHAWDWAAEVNQLTHHRVFQQFAAKPAGWVPGQPGYGGRPDGAAVDVQGNYYSAMFEGRRLCQFAPDGRLLAEIPTPAQCPTMPCFGGPDLRTLYLTTARHNRPVAELAALPASGCVFALEVEVPGLPVNFFQD